MEMTGEMMDDALEGALGGDSDLEGETADVMAQASRAGQGRGRAGQGTAHRSTAQQRTGMSDCENEMPAALPGLQVLDEIGVDLGSQLSAAPKQRLAAAQKQQQQEQQPEPEEDLLASRLAALK